MFSFLSNKTFSFLINDPIVYFDVGARGGLLEPWKTLESLGYLKVVCFEADPIELENLRSMYPDRIYVENGLYSLSTELDLYLCQNPYTSSIYEPNQSYNKNYADVHWVGREVERKVKISCTTLDLAVEKLDIIPDFIKIDTQGAEFDIISGGENLFQSSTKAPLGITVETWTREVYREAKLFDQVVCLIRKFGYDLFDYNVAAAWNSKSRDTFPETLKSKMKITGFDFLFFKSDEKRFLKESVLLYLFGFKLEALSLLRSRSKNIQCEMLYEFFLKLNSSKRKRSFYAMFNKYLKRYTGFYIKKSTPEKGKSLLH
jgi:FkbM family methyltransferase